VKKRQLNKNEKDKLYKFAEHIINAQLDCKAKSLLWFYAHTFNWTEGRPSFYSQDKICAYVGMSAKTYHKARKYLEGLGWIQVQKRGYLKPPLVWVMVGNNDTEYRYHSYAAGHPDLQGMESPEWNPFYYEGFNPLSPEKRLAIPL
jgi:hypothetical protein